jgi:DNA-binding transcriptional ArsR family regulator
MNETFKALSDPSRRKILELLKEKDMTAGEIHENFDMSKPSISQHLKILKGAGLVHDLKLGQYIYYSINTTVLQDLIGWAYDISKK